MEAKASPRKMKSREEELKDYYQTPPECTRALINNLLYMTQGNKFKEILDPCCGTGAIINELKDSGYNVIGYDLNFGENRKSFFDDHKQYDLIIMNQPYSLKYKFLDHAFKISKQVICILPMQIVNYNMFHKQYLTIPEYQGRLLLTPKIMMHEGREIKRGGVSSYAWFSWNRDNKESVKWELLDDITKYVREGLEK